MATWLHATGSMLQRTCHEMYPVQEAHARHTCNGTELQDACVSCYAVRVTDYHVARVGREMYEHVDADIDPDANVDACIHRCS